MKPYIVRMITKSRGNSFEKKEDYVAVEKKLLILHGGREILSLYCTPSMIKELVVGLLLTEGILSDDVSPGDMIIKKGKEIRVLIPAEKRLSTEGFSISRCLGGLALSKSNPFKKVSDEFSFSAEDLKKLFQEFQRRSELFRLTGCFHSAALSDGKTILAFAEDIGRHNTVDKVIGLCVLTNVPLTGGLMLTSCRISSEIVSKCVRWGIPILVSRAAPTDRAVSLADKTGLTLIGFVRGDSFNIYTNPQRITK